MPQRILSEPDAGAGLYTFLVSTPAGTQRQLHLRRHRAETETWGTNPALDAWRTAGLFGNWDPDFLARHRDRNRNRPPVDRSLVGLALALFLSGVLVDRTRLRITTGFAQKPVARPMNRGQSR